MADLFVIVAVLAFLVALPFGAVLCWKVQMLTWGRPVAEEGRLNHWAHRWHQSNVRARAKPRAAQPASHTPDIPIPDRSPAEVVEIRREARRKRLGTPQAQVQVVPVVSSVEDRLEAAYERLLAKGISIEEYRDIVDAEWEAAREAIEDLAAREDDMHPDVYELEADQAREALEATEWRRRWVRDRQYQDQFQRDGFGESGKWARFDYTDANGASSKREIVMWQSRGPYIVGLDKSRGEERNFRQDRISNWASG